MCLRFEYIVWTFGPQAQARGSGLRNGLWAWQWFNPKSPRRRWWDRPKLRSHLWKVGHHVDRVALTRVHRACVDADAHGGLGQLAHALKHLGGRLECRIGIVASTEENDVSLLAARIANFDNCSRATCGANHETRTSLRRA